jgi:hypothetical protein
MELLDGGDLRNRAPLPWAQACALLFDVCSSLALLHSRRLLHRDISPRNIRCTPDGKAKLIDFGAMAPMSAGGAQVVGTPAFTPPETVHRLALDARADLYSLGATLYHALTGQLPYPARTFAEVLSAWNFKVTPPSERVPGIPAALDDLVLSLISLEPALRPHSAFDVMQRLAAIADLARDESKDVSLAYLATPTLVGRAELLATLREKLLASRAARGAGLLIEGAAGVGRSRLLDACVLEAKTLGMTVLRATANGALEPFSTARGLTQHLLDALPSSSIATEFSQLLAAPQHAPANDHTPGAPTLPRLELKNFADPALDGEQLQQAISRFMLTVSRTHPLLIAVDDVHRIDQPSAAVLATLVDKARRGSIFVALTVDSAELANEAVDVLARRCERLALEPLTRDQTHLLLDSLFGDVAHLDMLANEIYEVALGNPRQCMDMAQHLIDQELIRYAAGTWTLPSRLSDADLPRSAADATRVRIQRLSSLARFLGEAQALAYSDTFAVLDCRALLPEENSQRIDAALSELLAMRAIVTDGSTYSLANRVWIAAFSAGLDDSERQRRHRALAEVYRGKSSNALIHHLFAAGLHEQGLDAMQHRNRGYEKGVDHKQLVKENIGKAIAAFPLAIDTALRLGRSARQVHELRRWYFAASATTDDSSAAQSARVWLQQLEYDSGLALFRQYADAANHAERLTRALQDAHQRHQATPEHERVYAVDEAIRLLAEYVVYSIAIGGRTQDEPLLASAVPILEPFAALSPVLDAIWNNVIATYRAQCECQYEFARGRWIEVLEKLDALSGGDIQHIDAIRNAVAYAIGLMEAQLGLSSATSWAARLDHDPYQKISALHLRRIVRLEQGDWLGADRLRRQAEVLSLQLRSPQMFKSLLAVELAACAKACDLVGIQHVIEQLKPLAARWPGWVPHLVDADARFHLVRGDLSAAKAGFERCIALTECVEGRSLCMAMWVASQAGLAETLLSMDRAEEARASASAALEVCAARQIRSHAYDLARMLALAEAKLRHAGAAQRLDALIAEQLQLGVTGLRLGLSYEARAQIALWTGDDNAFHHYARLTAREYRYGTHSPLGSRYERLVNEAGRHGLHVASALGDFETGTTIVSSALAGDDVHSMVQRGMFGAERSEQRADVALNLICDMRRSRTGHLYLLSGESLVLAASRGEAAPENLAPLVHEYLVQEQNRSETMTMMATGNLLDEVPDASSTCIGDTTYQFLLLSCVVDAVGKVAGVAAVVADETRVRNVKQGQLLSALATHLVTTDGGLAPS